MGIKERKNLEKSNMRELILRTAMNLFLDDGFDKITIRHIAEKIEYSPATIYLYFKNKDEILRTLCNEGFEELYSRQQMSLKTRDPLKRLRQQGQIYVAFALEKPQYYDLMFMMKAKQTNEMKELDMGFRSYEFLKKNVKDCIDSGIFPRYDVELAAFSLWSLVHGISSLVIRGRSKMFPEEQINSIINGALDFMLEAFVEKKSDNNKLKSGVNI